jgi:hypothetical protein
MKKETSPAYSASERGKLRGIEKLLNFGQQGWVDALANKSNHTDSRTPDGYERQHLTASRVYAVSGPKCGLI